MTRRIRLRPAHLAALAISLFALIVLAACGSTASGTNSGGSSGGTSAGSSVGIANFAFSPSKLTVKAGTTVTWTNKDSTAHNVVSTNGPGLTAATTSTFVSSTMNQGDTFSFTFTKPGTYYYECSIHKTMPTMHAVVIVK